jgi:hypothetical protein
MPHEGWADIGNLHVSDQYRRYRAFLAGSGFAELTRTKRGWTRIAQPG